MNLYKKQFSGLTADELYRILQARCAVFVVDKNVPIRIWTESTGKHFMCGSKTKANPRLFAHLCRT